MEGPMPWPAAVTDWNSTPAERAVALDCDALVPAPDAVLHRAVDVAAAPATTYRWLCQMRAAPYSYDWIDNLGRRSPQTLTPGLEDLAVGQRIATIFRITSFEPDRSITMLTSSRVLGRVACTYAALDVPGDPGRSRLLARLVVTYARRSPAALLLRGLLPPGDLVMMRRQLLNLRDLAAADGPGRAAGRGR